MKLNKNTDPCNSCKEKICPKGLKFCYKRQQWLFDQLKQHNKKRKEDDNG